MTVEESLTTFVTEILGFPVDDASEVILFVIGPIIAFYFFLTNMMTMAFENFEDRIGRAEWDKKEELPTNLKLFSLVTAFITVVTIGRIAPGLIMIFGALALVLGILMMTGLLTRDEDGNNGGGNTGGGDNNGNNGNEGDQTGDGATREDYIDRIADAGETITSGARDHLDERYENQLEESLRYFDEDMISEIERVQSKRSEVEHAISQAENEISDPSNYNPSGDPKDYDPRTFQKIIQKTKMIEKLLEGMGAKINDDFAANGPNPDYTNSELAEYVSGDAGIARKHGRNPMEEIASLNGKLNRILNSDHSFPPDDVFNEIIEELDYIVATGHFMNTCPLDLSKIATDREEAEKIVMKAASLNKIKDVSGRDENKELQILVGWMDARRDVINNLIKRSERLSKKELKLTKTEIEHIKQSLGEDKKIHKELNNIKESLGRYQNIKNLKEDVQKAENMMNEIDNKLATLESHANAHGKFESEIYQKLREAENRI